MKRGSRKWKKYKCSRWKWRRKKINQAKRERKRRKKRTK